MNEAEPETEALEPAAIDAMWATGGDVAHELANLLASHPSGAGLFPRLLEKLEDPAFGSDTCEGRTLRSVYVEAVLLGGYPWALHLDAADVASVRRAGTSKRGWVSVAVAAVVSFLAGLGLALAQAPNAHDVRPDQPPVERRSASPVARRDDEVAPMQAEVNESGLVRSGLQRPESTQAIADAVSSTAETMRWLIAKGETGRALSLGAGCVHAFAATRECMVMIASAYQHQQPPDSAAAKRWYALSQRQDVLQRTKEARALSEDRLSQRWAALLSKAESTDRVALLRTLEEEARTLPSTGSDSDR